MSTAADFDHWYAELGTSAAREDLLRRHLGLPPLLLVTGVVPWQGLDDVTTALRLVPGSVLLDLACGRGGYGLEVASRTRAGLVGVDFSSEAVRQAEANALAQDQEASFTTGDLERTGLEDHSVDAVMCLDSLHFASRPLQVYAEIRRVLRPGGRVVLTGWEARDRDDAAVPEHWRLLDLAGGLLTAGFDDVERETCPDWSRAERALWEEAVSLDAGADRGLATLVDEARSVLPTFDRLSRVMVTGTAR